jgi:hypothetical protein
MRRTADFDRLMCDHDRCVRVVHATVSDISVSRWDQVAGDVRSNRRADSPIRRRQSRDRLLPCRASAGLISRFAKGIARVGPLSDADDLRLSAALSLGDLSLLNNPYFGTLEDDDKFGRGSPYSMLQRRGDYRSSRSGLPSRASRLNNLCL